MQQCFYTASDDGAHSCIRLDDNFDLLVSTPNGRETHAMDTEFQIHPAVIIETGSSQPGISTLTILRLTPKQVKSVNSNRAIPCILV